MSDLPLKVAVHYQVTRMRAADRIKPVLLNEKGEMGSWLILAAGLALAAAAAVTTLSGWFDDKANEITDN